MLKVCMLLCQTHKYIFILHVLFNMTIHVSFVGIEGLLLHKLNANTMGLITIAAESQQYHHSRRFLYWVQLRLSVTLSH